MLNTHALVDIPRAPRTIILCFDGTGNKFGEENSNVVRFFKALIKDQTDNQIVYYQPGIGTYNTRQFVTRSVTNIASAIDKGIALHLNDHVKEGYLFIMKNYRKGDKICLFGFSRGAHTARVVAGMLYKVGLLPPNNDEQVDFAFSVYQATGSHGVELSKEFKKTFAIPVTVEFVGVWDTVSSVGIFPRSHPYTSVNYAVKTFRHALALDERRARFRPSTWNEPTLEREQDLDVDDPNRIIKPRTVPRDDWEYEPPDRTTTDVKEVWFSGAHADVGGGSHNNTYKNSLSFIPLRWMIKECLVTGTGILFDQHVLKSLGFDFKALQSSLSHELQHLGLTLQQFGFDDSLGQLSPTSPRINGTVQSPVVSPTLPNLSLASGLLSSLPETGNLLSVCSQIIPECKKWLGYDLNIGVHHAKDITDCVERVWDQLIEQQVWWVLEIIPTLSTYQQPDGNWLRKRTRNFGQGRYIHFFDNRIFVHKSVKDKVEKSGGKYKPIAFNWDTVEASDMLEYVS